MGTSVLLLGYFHATLIAWRYPEKFKNIIFRLGVFYIIFTLVSTIGKRLKCRTLEPVVRH